MKTKTPAAERPAEERAAAPDETEAPRSETWTDKLVAEMHDPSGPEAMREQFAEERAARAAPARKPVEAWRDELGTDGATYDAMRAAEQWPLGAELNESEYRDALRRFADVVVR